ncbi:MAG: metallophosphoesterase family protein [Tepidisphaerales bacterium]
MPRILLTLICLFPLFARADEPTRFLIFADTRDKVGYDKVYEIVNRKVGSSVSFIVAPGDMTPLPKTRGVIDRVFGQGMPWYPVIGNHETAEKPSMQYLHDFYRKQLKGRVNPGPAGTEETTYSFDAGPIHFTAINVYWNGKTAPGSETKTDGDVVPPLREWIKADLQKSDKPWKLVVGHEPAYPAHDRDWLDGRHEGSSLNEHKENRDAFWKMLGEQNATAYICGHTHRYSRTQPEGGRVWQIDSAQLRGDDSWKFDTFIVVTADDRSIKFETYRNLKQRGRFEVTDMLTLPPAEK